MTLNINIIALILFIHWIADFVLQTLWQSTNKSKNVDALLNHTVIYTLCFLPLGFFIGLRIVMFISITFITHTLTDFVTSRMTARRWEKKEVHNFFVVVGADQFLHVIQLMYTYYLLSN